MPTARAGVDRIDGRRVYNADYPLIEGKHPMSAASDVASSRRDPSALSGRPAAWGGIYAMALSTFVLVASEFMPVSLLSPIANELRLTVGQAGQAVSVCSASALVTSLSIARLFSSTDRSRLLIGLTSLMIGSGLLIAFAPTFMVLLAGRLLLGVAIGGFWSLSAAAATRLVPERSAITALAIINGGNALATALAAPLASYLGSFIGWRGAFFCMVLLALIAVIWQVVSVPTLPARPRMDTGGMIALLRQPGIAIGFVGVVMFFGGQFSLYTYLRPFLEQVTGASTRLVSVMLLIVGGMGFVGTILVTRVIGQRLHRTIAILSCIMAATGFSLAVVGKTTIVAAALLAVWGCVSTGANVVWWTWVTRSSVNPEPGGGLMVAAAQVGVTSGASFGGIIFDAFGPVAPFLFSTAILVAAALVAFASGRHTAASCVDTQEICTVEGVAVQ